ncbi:MAG: hypothetical protein ACRD3M_03670 [Thermoanaerobaculia bacterium]
MIDRETLSRLARETGALLGELGVRPSDRQWIRRHAGSVASLEAGGKRRRVLADLFYRLARRAARTAR